jgi:LuxR family maltose regulon positive regulatory protein
MPPSLHLALATRSDPPLPLGRLRTEGEMTEVRAAELRFSDAEAAALLAAAVGVELDAEDVARLQERTEGWPAGLYLAALSLRGRDDARDFIASFAGDERHIVDYLVSEVLAGLPEGLRTFLLRTSILDRMCAPLCDAVAGAEGSARTLERIERSNMFLVPLDSTREWYRYHHLFRDLLGHELAIVEPALVPDLHRRAFEWHRAAGEVAEAIHHAAAAGDVGEVRELIAEHWNAAFNQGRLETVERWLESIPRGAVASDPRLCVARAWLAMDSGDADTARRWIAAAEEGLEGRTDAGDVELDTAVLRAVHRLKVGDIGQAETVARRMLELGPSGDPFAWTVAHLILGASLYWRGAPSEAVDALREAAHLAREAGNDLGQSYGLGYQALAQAELGELEEAEALAARALDLSDDPGFVEHFVSMAGHLARGTVEQRRGRPGAAEASLVRAVELARRGAGQLELAAALLALGEVRDSLGDRDGARGLVREARRALVNCADPGMLGSRMAAAERAVHTTPRSRPDEAGAEELTERELAVLRLLNSELSLREVGTALFVSLNTVKTHTRGIYRKLGAATRADAVRRARELKLL